MRTIKPRVSLLYLSAIDECKAAGVDLTPDEYVWIYDACNRAIDANGNDCPPLIEIPVTIGNVTLWPMTIGAMVWWNKYGREWYEGDAIMEVMAIAFCMAHSHDVAVFQSMHSKTAADLHLIAWQIKTAAACTVAQLSWGIDKVNGQYDYVHIDSPNEVKADQSSSVDWGAIVAKLCGAYHQPAEYFLWKISERAAIELLENAPAPFGYDKQSDATSSRRYCEMREVVRHIIQSRKKAA